MKKSPRVHLICSAHLDPIWQWGWEEGLTEAMATFEVAADLMEEYPKFIFNHNESLLYEWTKMYRPDLFERIRKWVLAGRWNISGGWYLQPDCNFPCGESFIRQGLLGRTFFQKEFGVEPKVAYNFDSFGHHGNLPQILREMGYEMYVHFRPLSQEKEIEDFLYCWRGIDGSEITTLRPPCGWYNTATPEDLRSKIEMMLTLARETGRDITAFWGGGDHGGGATREDLEMIRKMSESIPEIGHSSLEAYWQALPRDLSALPVVEGELQKCMTGCYTSVIGTKQRNRRGEGLVLAAERYAALAWWKLGKPYPQDKLKDVWKKILYNQFHDILPGSSVRRGTQDSIEIYGHAFTLARELLLSSQLALLQTSKPRKPLALLIFNPQAVARRQIVEVDFTGAPHPHQLKGKTLQLLDSDGHPIVFQQLEPASSPEWRRRLLFEANLPALGIAEYRIKIIDGAEKRYKAGIEAQQNKDRLRFDTRHYSLALDMQTGWIVSLQEKFKSMELLSKPGGVLLVREDTLDAWNPLRRPYGKVIGKFRCPSKRGLSKIVGNHEDSLNAAVKIVESGPIATTVEVVQVYGRSIARLRYTFYTTRPEIDLELQVNWAERKRVLQLSFPTVLDSERYTVEVPHGALERSVGNSEEPCGRWTMLTSSDYKTAFAIVNDGPGGVDVNHGELRQSLVRSPIFCFSTDEEHSGYPQRLSDHMDLGEHTFRFFLQFGKTTEVRTNLPVLADDLMMPPTALVHIPLGACPEKGLEPGKNIVWVDGKGIRLAALKQSDDGEDLIVRLIETTGKKNRGQLHIDGLDSPVNLSLASFEIKTLRIRRSKGSWTCKECDLLERVKQ